MKCFLLSVGALFACVNADSVNCTFRSPDSPVHLTITDNAKHSKSIGTKVRTCDSSTCGDRQGQHKFIDCPVDLAIGGSTDVLVDNDLT